jgi:L-lactate dehydrogenase complex protein LldG
MNGDARGQILAAIRAGLGRGPLGDGARAEIEARLAAPGPNVVPARGQGDATALVARFIAEAERVSAVVERLAGWEAVPLAVAACLDAHGLPPVLKVAPDPLLDGVPWAMVPRLEIARGAAVDADRASVTAAFAGIAETGTLMLMSGPESPTTLNFLPQLHIVVLPAARIVGCYEDAFARLRAARAGGSGGGSPEGMMPRVVNWITGPSRTADIEQTLLLGVHGPRQLQILILGG